MEPVQIIALLLVAVVTTAEVIFNSIHQLELYDLRDSLSNFLMGVFTVTVSLLMKGIMLAAFTLVAPYALLKLPTTLWSLGILFLLSDMQYYWFHRLGHVSRFFWASHVIHHSSNKYNYSVGLRLPFTNGFYRLFFWSPICLLGFSPICVLMMDSALQYYTFFLHTETIGKLGWIEKILNSPSHHRVHHSSNPKYLDKNYGAILIIWDKLFGTYIDEEEKPRYGLTKSFQSYNPVKITLDGWSDMIRDLKLAGDIREIIKVIFGRPAWKPPTRKIIKLKTKYHDWFSTKRKRA